MWDRKKPLVSTDDTFSRRRGDELTELLCTGIADSPAVESATNELLNEVFDGYPINELRRLTRSSNPTAVKAGSWILSELGPLAAPMMSEITALLEHPLRYVRFFAIDAVLSNAEAEDGRSVAKVISLLADPDEGVRWKVLRFLSQATTAQLTAGARDLAPPSSARLTNWLAIDSCDSSHVQEVVDGLSASDRLTRMFAAAAAARLARTTLDAVKQAAESEDAEIRSFAQEELRLLGR